MPTVTEREDYDEMLDKLLSSLSTERVLRLFEPRAVLEYYKPEERLAGLAPEDVLLAMPVEVLRGLSDDYLRTLPEHVQQAIRTRLAGAR